MVKGSSLTFGADYTSLTLQVFPPSVPFVYFPLLSPTRPQGFEFLARILIGLCRLMSPPDQGNIYN